MKVRVLFFGATADIVGNREIEIPLTEGVTINDAFADVIASYPLLSDHQLRYSLNQQYVPDNVLLHDGDELAVFTAVSGG